MTVIVGFEKQPAEVKRQRLEYQYWVMGMTVVDIDVEITPVTVPPLTVSTIIKEGEVSLFIGGGVDGEIYTVEMSVELDDGRLREDEVQVRVKEIA